MQISPGGVYACVCVEPPRSLLMTDGRFLVGFLQHYSFVTVGGVCGDDR